MQKKGEVVMWMKRSVGILALLGILGLGGAGALTVAQPTATTRAVVAVERVLDETPIRAFVARVDLTAPGVKVRCLPAGAGGIAKGPWPTTLETTSAVAAREKLAVAVNGDFFTAEQAKDAEGQAAQSQYVRGKRANVVGMAVSGGKVWARGKANQPMLVVDKDGKVSITEARDGLAEAREVISGNRMLVEDGKLQVVHIEKEKRHPRTAVGLTEDGKTLILVAVDGRSLTSRGMTLGELATFMQKEGAFTAFNLDGGGSTTMVQRVGEKQTVLNTPSDGVERPVADVLGVEVP
jgi:exopolysaccharide biosynthesis protein